MTTDQRAEDGKGNPQWKHADVSGEDIKGVIKGVIKGAINAALV